MWHVLVWVPIALLLLAWSLLCWAGRALLNAAQQASPHDGGWLAGLERWQIPAWLADWLPLHLITMFKTWLTGWGPWLEDLVAQAPSLLAWMTPLLWGVWLAGVLGLLLMGLVGSVLVAALKRA